MTRRTLIATASLALSAAAGFFGTDRALAADQHITRTELVSSAATARFLPLVVNTSVVIELPRDIRDVLVSGPEIIHAVVRTNRRVYVVAVAIGETDVFFFDAEGRQIEALHVYVKNLPPPAPFVGNPEPPIDVTIFRGSTGASITVHCMPTNCIAASSAKPASADSTEPPAPNK
jgi:Flp pilus assembly secretin CpaC